VSLRGRLERYFELQALGTTWRTEVLAGCTTFVTMAYIVFVNPSILSVTGMPAPAVTVATCLASAIGCFLMGAIARYPIALAPGMGLNAYFAFAVCQGMGVPWQAALGAVFLSGVIFLLLTAAGIRQLIVRAIPHDLYAAVAVGIGLFIAFIGLKNAGLVVDNPATLVGLGSMRNPGTALALFGLVLTAALLARGYRAAILIGVIATTLASLPLGLSSTPTHWGTFDLSATFLQLDLGRALQLGFLEIVFVFLFVDLFDNIGTLLAVGKRAGLVQADGEIPRLGRILTSDALATTAGSLLGTSTVVSYIESASGVAAGGRSGITAIVTGLLFVAAVFLAPLAGVVPLQATAPALIIVGALMMSHATEIRWSDPLAALPAFLTLLSIPLTFSIANGLAFGFTVHTLLQVAAGRARSVNWLVYLLTGLFLLRFFYLAAG
jgi:AGZA family xanthine/uracil permease-like MFS transporter